MTPIHGATLAKPAKDYLNETPLSVRAELLRSIEIYGNEDTIMKDGAIEAIVSDRAAYWTMASYNNARASDLPYALNRGVDIVTTINAEYRTRPESKMYGLDTLIPLNRKAVNALAKAYLQFGTFRDDEELEARREHDPRPSVRRQEIPLRDVLRSKGAV